MATAETAPAIDKLFIDLGAESREQAQSWGVALGDTIVPDGPFTPTEHPERFLAKAFDNRAGCAALAQVFKRLPAGPPCRPVAVATVQEEVGCRGAVVAGAQVLPDGALVLEGPPRTTRRAFRAPSRRAG